MKGGESNGLGISNKDGAFRSTYGVLVFTGLGRNAGAILRPDVKRLLTRPFVRKKGEMCMVMFVDQEKMSPIQLALETARYQLGMTHGGTISWPDTNSGNYSHVIDNSEALQRIEAAFEYLATACDTKT